MSKVYITFMFQDSSNSIIVTKTNLWLILFQMKGGFIYLYLFILSYCQRDSSLVYFQVHHPQGNSRYLGCLITLHYGDLEGISGEQCT